ncbi:DmpA/ArgJ-like protein [Myriangium duriaei CBS 260.36]|uniref:DmpA/ArgJ-like protein n=1 Tax=Myriangium duriaei CBS 260.36 TaxID=1168546 RepID=A0A9P4J9M2_9PEZI|nr:DmpA/ArgJ-like protein [Myriangium duriaei CBS 260.36]
MRIRDLGYSPGTFPTGPSNSVLDVPGVGVGQVTLPTTSDLKDVPGERPCPKKGVTVILPRPVDSIHIPCHAGTHTFNGNGELTGRAPIEDWGFINMPIVLTNSCSLGACYDGSWDFMMSVQDRRNTDALQRAREYGTPVVGETADWWINSTVRETKISAKHVAECFENVKTREQGGEVLEGSYGGGAGMTCQQYKGGTGTASRIVDGQEGKTGFTVGVVVQTNYGHRQHLQIGGIPMGRIFGGPAKAHKHAPDSSQPMDKKIDDGSLLVIIFTDAPLLPHQLNRLARHATVGVAQVGTYGIGRTFSGDIFLAVSTAEHPIEQLTGENVTIGKTTETYKVDVVKNESIDAYFEAVAEATEEAILNSMVGARDGMAGMDGGFVEGLPVDRVRELLSKYRAPMLSEIERAST